MRAKNGRAGPAGASEKRECGDAGLPLPPGTRFGPYAIVAPIGAGGMGEVYRASDPRLGRDVAIKVLPPSVVQDEDRRARFEREARALAALSHPNIINIFDTGVHEDHPFVVMELLDGETLRDRLTRFDLAASTVRPWLAMSSSGHNAT